MNILNLIYTSLDFPFLFLDGHFDTCTSLILLLAKTLIYQYHYELRTGPGSLLPSDPPRKPTSAPQKIEVHRDMSSTFVLIRTVDDFQILCFIMLYLAMLQVMERRYARTIKFVYHWPRAVMQ